MFKRIRRYFRLQKIIQHEVLETLCTICLYLEHDGHFDRNPYARCMGTHFKLLKVLSTRLREEVLEDGTERDIK